MKCTECGRIISEEKQACWYCGCPIEEIHKDIEMMETIDNYNIKMLAPFMSEEGVLDIPDYVECLGVISRWYRVKRNAKKEISKIIVHNTVKSFHRTAFLKLKKDIKILFVDEDGYNIEKLSLQPDQIVYINYKNTDLQQRFCELGIRYQLYDVDNEKVMEYVDRNKENGFYAPYITEKEREDFTEKLINEEPLHIPDTIKMLKRNDLDWDKLTAVYKEKCRSGEKFRYKLHIWLSDNVCYIDEKFFYTNDSDSPVFIEDADDEEYKREYVPAKYLTFHCSENSLVVGEQLLTLGAAVFFRDVQGYDTYRFYGKVSERNAVLFPTLFLERTWTKHNTEVEQERIFAESGSWPKEIHIPDSYNHIEKDAFESLNENVEVIFWSKNMSVGNGFGDINYLGSNVKRLYIPYKCYVDNKILKQFDWDITIFCEENSSAELKAKNAGKRVQYYDFNKKCNYKKGERTLEIIRTTFEDLVIMVNERGEAAGSMLKAVFSGYSILRLNDTEDFEVRYRVLKVLQNTNIDYIIDGFYD